VQYFLPRLTVPAPAPDDEAAVGAPSVPPPMPSDCAGVRPAIEG
jgi:hypothetical protein